MLNDMPVNDLQLIASDIRQLENADEIMRFFARLGYDVDGRINIPDFGVLGLGSAELRQQIHKIELIGTDPEDGDIVIYLFEVRSVTAKLRNDIARRFRERPENALLVLTKEYEQLEFVLLQKSEERSRSKFQPLKLIVRPLPLTVDRLNPDPVALRVLKRFTFTEEDSAYQWEKLRSAYTLAEWSEEYFNNRALFSDYYLNQRLADPKITPAWAEDVRPIGRVVYGQFVTARREYTRKSEQIIRNKLYEPLFQQLGFTFKRPEPQDGGARRGGHGGTGRDGHGGDISRPYMLYAPGDLEKPIAAALTYVWNRNLDDVDEARELAEADGGTPTEIPGALVVSLLESPDAPPWVIVTNGKLWRLYSATASNKATNYYEVDLEEALAANDQLTALKYWWLLFRREAFTGFLDALLKNSADYAKELGERLKERVFVDIFPQFAKGFIADIQANPRTDGIGTRTDGIYAIPTDLELAFSGTMTFLYRLIFLLYAESLELLPIYEANGYRELSLYRMKREIAEVGGTLLDLSPDVLSKHYSAKSTVLYERLKALFAVIDQGSDELNMPTYNGGLFSSQTESGQFLNTYAIPDRFLALGLDRLARDLDTRTKALVFIDFKSLGVRQLGSIYEGLLEFKLRIATEKLAVTKEKNKEVYQQFAMVKKPLATINKGDVYLENDKQERKATGSYYTPDYIVKYIVQHTVGPVLDRTFEQLTPRLRAAQKGYRDYAKLAEARRKSVGSRPHPPTPSPRTGEEEPEGFLAHYLPSPRVGEGSGVRGQDSPHTYWNRLDMQQLVDDCLNIRCLDPAMGSGHFLVEVVDYVSNRLISFLNGWSENPVWAFVEQTRTDILGDMERQRVTIDAERLTRVALLKRAVLKRCVYGVDLNAMAVELAKVSLWLDAFTLGAPLSFLDHHLKHGNSLIGARIKDVQEYLKASDQIDMFSGSKFTGVMLATDLMRKVSYLSDNTVEQTQRSAEAYRDASDHLAPYKRLLDVYTSRWFGNQDPLTPSPSPRTGEGRKRTRAGKADYVRLFLEEPQTEAWLHDPDIQLDDRLIPATQIAQTALDATKQKRFFHWELEFPEVFFAPSTPGGQDVQLREGGGFDAVVGNPPYVRQEELASIKQYFSVIYPEIYHSTADLYVYFFGMLAYQLGYGGYLGFISSGTFQRLAFGAPLRYYLTNKVTLTGIVGFEKQQIFTDAITYPIIITIKKQMPENLVLVPVNKISDLLLSQLNNPTRFSLSKSDEVWNFSSLQKVLQGWDGSNELGTLMDGPAYRGITTGLNDAFVIDQATYEILLQVDPSSLEVIKPFVSGDDIERWHQPSNEKWLIFLPAGWTKVNLGKGMIEQIAWDKFRLKYPAIANHLINFVDAAQRRLDKGDYWWELRPCTYYNVFETPRIHSTKISFSPTFSFSEEIAYAANTSYVLSVRKDINAYYILTILNSKVCWYFCSNTFAPKANGYYEVQPVELTRFPIRRITFTTPAAERTQLTQAAIASYAVQDNAAVLAQMQAAIDGDKTDVVHDLLAHLAQRMIDLNKSKQAEVKRFLGWLEGQLWSPHPTSLSHKGRGTSDRSADSPLPGVGAGSGVRAQGIDSLPGRTVLQGYLGDYQKGERELPWRDFFYRLHQNRTRFAASLSEIEGEIEREYEHSLAVLLPIKRELARTDTLIDKIVYRLYGLTAAEIELIERPQYEQALTNAKAAVMADKAISDDEARIDKIAENILPIVERFFERVAPASDEEILDRNLPNWRTLPPAAPTFLLTGDYNLRTLPDQMDFSASVIPYTKAVEVALYQRIFIPFRAASGYTHAACKNDFLKKFMRGEKELTLGSFGIILKSSEPALRTFIEQQIHDAANRIFGITGAVALLNDGPMIHIRNKAAHDEVLTRSEAQAMREWALGILALM